MLTNKDIEKLVAVFPTKQEVRAMVQEEIAPLEQKIERTLTALDRLAKAIEDLTLEFASVNVQLSRHEKWIRQIAKEAGVTLRD